MTVSRCCIECLFQAARAAQFAVQHSKSAVQTKYKSSQAAAQMSAWHLDITEKNKDNSRAGAGSAILCHRCKCWQVPHCHRWQDKGGRRGRRGRKGGRAEGGAPLQLKPPPLTLSLSPPSPVQLAFAQEPGNFQDTDISPESLRGVRGWVRQGVSPGSLIRENQKESRVEGKGGGGWVGWC